MKKRGNTVDIRPYQANGPLRCAPGSIERSAARALYRRLHRVVALGAATRNQAECVAILMDKLKIQPRSRERSYRLLVDRPRFTPDAAFDSEGFMNLSRCAPDRGRGRPSARRKILRSFLLPARDRTLGGRFSFLSPPAGRPRRCWGSDPCRPQSSNSGILIAP